MRGFADGFVSVLLARYLSGIGFSPLQIGAVITCTLIGSGVLTLAVGVASHQLSPRPLLLAASFLMALTGLGFAAVTWFWPLLLVALVGTLNPSSGDVSVFLPTEQAFIAGRVGAAERPRAYAVYNLAGALAGSLGALASAVPEPLGRAFDWEPLAAQRTAFVVYVAAALATFVVYRGLRDDTPSAGRGLRRGASSPRPSRRMVVELAALFSLDSAASGLVVQSLLVLWLHLRFGLASGVTGAVFFGAGLLGAASQLLAGRLADRIGLVRTMVFTHVPANLLLVAAAFAPRAGIAVAALLARSVCASMDQPARQAFVMAVVPPEDRAVAASITNVPRSFAGAAAPLFAGVLLSHSTIGWPLLVAGTVKIVYDLLLWSLYRNVSDDIEAHR